MEHLDEIISTLTTEIRESMKTTIIESLLGMNIQPDTIETISEKIDKVKPEKNLTDIEKMFGEGSFL